MVRWWPRTARKKQRKVYKNEDIKAFSIMLIDEKWEQLGKIPRAKALAQAQELGLDLVQLSYDPKDKVATAKMIDYGKYMYDKKRKESDKKKQQKAMAQKEIKFWYNIGDHDLEIKLKRAKDFLDKWHAVKLMVVLRGRERVYKELVRWKFEHIQEALAEHGKSQWIKEEQTGFLLLLIPKRR